MPGKFRNRTDKTSDVPSGCFLSGYSSFICVLVCFLGLLNAVASADQRDPELASLFARLQTVSSAGEAEQLESRIWLVWLETDDTMSEILLQRVVDSMGSGDLDEALIASNELVDGNPEFAEGWNKRATVHYLMGNYNSSVEDIHRTLQLEPRHFGAISGLGLIFLRKGNLSAALEAFERVLQLSPRSLNAQRSVDQVRRQIG